MYAILELSYSHESFIFYTFTDKTKNMKNIKSFLVLIFILALTAVSAQNDLPMPLNLKAAFNKGTRDMSGQTGKNYWQNTADYTIQLNFEPTTRRLVGTVTIDYVNNSPDTLKELVFKLYPNYYQAGAPRLEPIKLDKDDAQRGVSIEKITLDNEVQDASKREIQVTNMYVTIKPLAPKQTIHVKIDYSYTLNKESHRRTGEVDEGTYFMAYFFPRITVYDDIDGWNMNPYMGTQEFYNDFCNFKADITVPKNYVVWATGDLKNCENVLNEPFCKRLRQAEQNDGFVTIIDSTDIAKGGITADKPTNTFTFEAKNVTDFVFATSNHYMWQSSSLIVDKTTGRRTRVDAVFNQKHKDYLHVVSDARKTVEAMSYSFPKWAFPYNHETVFDGLAQMEYPMMANDISIDDRAESVELTDHEIFHTMFPFYMGINETKYAWMDEGWATLGEWLISPMIDATLVDSFALSAYETLAGTERDLPLSTLSTQLSGISYFINAYSKPGLGYLYLKDMLGDDLFYKGLHHYIRTWQGKHPIPYDFFNCMNVGTGRNLNWFWQSWFFDNGFPNLAIGKVNLSSKQKDITIESKGSKPVPIDITITYSDNSTETIHRSIEVWQTGNKTVQIPFVTNKIVKQITLGSTYTVDVDKSNNVFLKSK